ncbi:MAG: 50S ribosomal protein L1 [Chloroflexota bacterium]
MAERGKKYQEAVKLLEKAKAYLPEEAVALAKKMGYTKFDETVNLSLRMGVDPRAANQQVRGVALLPNGLGKQVRVLVFVQGEGEKLAQEAGADHVGSDELIKKVEGGWLDFEVAMATPDMMGRVGRLGRVLGRRGLMPNPKAGTVVQQSDLPRAIADARKGRVEFKLNRSAIIHVPVGKLSFDEKKLAENVVAVIDAINRAKPSGAKGQYFKSAYLSSTMGPGIKLDLRSVLSTKAA